MTSQAEGTRTAAAATWLDSLAVRLRARGWQAALHAPSGRMPMLDVTNPAVPQLADRVTAALGSDGRWWLWWSFAERIGPADDLDKAVQVITRVLGPRSEE